ncbi:rabenosyn-5 [Osmia lignaria lignaria]|uniref:rabenosyn-5 n=1 Tax=Osmia lignaria lignaria TaxID=1437193 RepID=UPI001479816F|nr:rabenosyn-5 [Osmia lignaria]XP_034187931.1 rabenosyn-5 [Osmia lignaria]XP_034187932.1 rabenosyn-5 [Osmia lignaria]
MAGSEEVLEGFICPICMTDFKAPYQLTKHFEDFHNDDPEILKSLKDLFGKAKKKILKQDEISESFAENISHKRQRSPEINWGPQEIGAIKSHTKYFKEIRNMRLERYSSETNKLLIRLDKLLNNLPNDPVDRKVHERTIVPWIDEKDVKLCPTCAKSFHVARRKHHCRLCGAVMCHSCTIFLSLHDAKKMTSPVSVQDDLAVSPVSERPISERIVRAGIGLTKLARSPSSSSLNSVLSLVNDSTGTEQHFRICTHCANLLDAREKQKAKHFDKPIVCQFYEKMRSYMEEASQHVKMYNKMWESLSEGESTYNLEDAQTLRVKIAKLGENIDLISKRISVLGTKCVESPPQEQEVRLHHMVRVSAMIFLKEELLSVQALPSPEKYAELQKERQKRLEARIAYERQLEEEQRERSKEQRRREGWNTEVRPPVKDNTQDKPAVVLNQSQGWGPSNVTPIMPPSMDPIIEQMSNLRAYIKQARADCRYDEVATLESNLKELQSAYFTMKQSNNSDG